VTNNDQKPPEAKNTTTVYHKSVLVQEVLEYLKPQPNGLYVDATFGGGGHTRAILEAEPTCKVIALDWDKEAINRNEPKLAEEFGDRLQVIWGNFIHLDKLLKKEKIDAIDGILADFGTSQFQIHQKAGFSFSTDTPLDMRMSPAHQLVWAADLINSLNEKDLANLFYEYGEEFRSRIIARAIVAERKKKRIATTKQLVDIIESVIPHLKGRGIHPATKVFQALRIKVNNELDNITLFLKLATSFVRPSGRIVCISFHSLEDRIVKTFFKEQKELLSTLTPKPVTGTSAEIARNASARSAKLRAAEKK
jgi:16S rRNA (cytosine1402-N4)-methyltransferase